MNLQELKDLCRQRGLKAVFNEDSVSKSMASVSIVLSVSSKKSKEKKSRKKKVIKLKKKSFTNVI
jgi:hypothetical protein